MSIHLQMTQIARLAPKILDDATELVQNFILSTLHKNGGVSNRAGDSDLYYTVFGLECLRSLGANLPEQETSDFLLSFKEVKSLDFIHQTCLARAWAILGPNQIPSWQKDIVLQTLKKHKCSDGNFNSVENAAYGTAYGSFLAYAAYQDLKEEYNNTAELIKALDNLKTKDNAYSNAPGQTSGIITATAAVVTLKHQLLCAPEPNLIEWLLQHQYKKGGFFALKDSPIPDLLSTATALHALSILKFDLSLIADINLDFIDTLWTNKGGFYGSWADDKIDAEYTFYAMLSLGHLS